MSVCANRLCSPAGVGSPGRSRTGTCCRSSRSRDGEPGSAPPIPARSPPARHARAGSLPGWAVPAGRARCRRTPARPSGSRPPRTQGMRPRDRRRSKRTRKNMRHPPSSAPSPEAAGRPCAPGQDAQTAPCTGTEWGPATPDTICRPPANASGHDAIPPRWPAIDITGQDVLAPSSAGTIRTSRRPTQSRLSRVSRPPWHPPS